MSGTTPAALRPGLTSLSPGFGRTRTLALGALGAAAIALIQLLFLWDRTINHDTAWYLISTRKWLEGARLYVDLYDVNPPLASYLTVPAILLSDAFSIGDANGQYALLAGLTGVSLFWGWSILIGGIAPGTPRQHLALFGLGAVLTVPALPEIGQREPLLMLFVMPWFLGQLPAPGGGVPGRPGRVLRALFAATGICLKPYYLTIPAAVVLWQMLAHRSLRPLVTVETLAMLAAGLLYVLATTLLHRNISATSFRPRGRSIPRSATPPAWCSAVWRMRSCPTCRCFSSSPRADDAG